MDTKRKYLALNCEICGVEYHQQERLFRKAKWKMRCKEHRKCMEEKPKKKAEKTESCIDCGTPIYKGSTRCRQCSSKNRRTAKQNYCIDCGTEIHRQATRCKRCYDIKQTIHGDTRSRFQASKEWADVRNKAFERDKWACVSCGCRGGILNAHHVKMYRDYPELRLDLDNIQTLCEPCHKKAHSDYRGSRRASSKLNESDVIDIRNRIKRGESQTSISKIYNVSQSTIQSINAGRTWGHVKAN